MNNTWAIRIFDTFWFLEYQQEDHLKDPNFVRKVAVKLTQSTEVSAEITEQGDFDLDDSEAAVLGERLWQFLETLRPLLKAIETDTFDEAAALALLKPLIEGVSGRRRLVSQPGEGSVLVFEPDRRDGDYVMAELALQWYGLLFEDDRTRLHFCEAPTCGCLFFDTSKNHTKRHCSERCSNRMKAQRHRSKSSTVNARP